MGSGDTRMWCWGGRPAFRLLLLLGNLILQAGPAHYACLNETIPSVSGTAEIKRLFYNFAPTSLAHPTSLASGSVPADVPGLVCPGRAVNPHLNLGFQGQIEPREMGSCIIDGNVIGEQM